MRRTVTGSGGIAERWPMQPPIRRDTPLVASISRLPDLGHAVVSRRPRHGRPCSFVALVPMLVVLVAGCGGDASFSSGAVADAFARQSIPVAEHRAGERGDPLLTILRPSSGPAQCRDHLAINVFSDSDEVDSQIARSGLTPGESRYVTKSEDGEQVIGLVRDNVLVALTDSDCFTEARVRTALNEIGG